ncbi:phosphohistidine phosphatase [Pararhodospirillum oryzae]|uniref:Phosphohistidine phosphatase n=1 Tax=Pararhodospirillum oryzae TaxID=478448 RepID=A0A512HAW5_9PROT|nr:phosphohistidine phosphatase [Pararhodospirillum oryzae]
MLLRHGKSDWSTPGLDDAERPLAARGERAAGRMGGRLAQAALTLPALDLVLCSPARRARETLALIRPALPEAVPVHEEAGLYVFEPDPLLGRLRALEESLAAVLVVGHNPALEQVARRLAGPGSDPKALSRLAIKFPTAALAELWIEGPWSTLAEAPSRLIAFDRPRDL